ncbi:MAG: C45 family peptidase [Nanoarchaeota archaeon]
MRHLTVNGTLFDCSYQLGQRLRKEIQARLRYHHLSASARGPQWKRIHQFYHYCKKHYPRYLEELAALAEGSRSDFLELFYLNCPELSQAHHGCSSIAIVSKEKARRRESTGQTLLAHNEDGEPGEGGTLVTYKLPKLTFNSFVYYGELPGSAYNWNEHGLFFTVNYIPVTKIYYQYAPYYFLTRKILECRNLTAALQVLRTSPCASGFHCYIGQGKRILSVEKWGRRTSIKEVKGIDFHTNHFLHSEMQRGSEVRKGSLIRLRRLQELARPGKTITSATLLRILFDRKNRPYPVYSTTGDKMRTLSTVVMEGGKVMIYDQRKKSLIFRAKVF